MPRPILLPALVLALAACGERHEAAVPDPASRRPTPAGDVVGTVGRYGSFLWLGIPYAAPPVGARRWRAPAPPERWTGVRRATEPGAPCVQYASPLGGIRSAPANTPVGDEDCLTLNVYAPRDATPASRLPVMVWIHGGGNSIGAATLYDGGRLAAAEGVVVVTVNYRLGPFGWLRHPALRAEATSDLERSGNFALLDLVQALEWVRDGIAAFGGDRGRVTVFGESAGGTNTIALLLARPARGLFQRAIVQSGSLRSTEPSVGETGSRETGEGSNVLLARLLVHDGRAPTDADEPTAIAPDEVARYLRGKSAVDVLEAYTPLPNIGMVRLPTLFADGAVLPRDASLAAFRRRDGWNRVPVMLGTNRDETKLFMFASPLWVRRWFGIVPRLRDGDAYDRTAGFTSRMWKASGADEIATAMLASGKGDVFVYRFDWDEEPTVLGADLSRMLGAAHGLEIPFVFGHFDLGRAGNVIFDRDTAAAREALSAAMRSYWTAFAQDGRPGRGRREDLPSWPVWSARPSFLVLDTPDGGGIRPATETETREGVLASVADDPRLGTDRDRCLVYHDLVVWSSALSPAQYVERCPRLSFDAYPWSG